MLVHFAPIHIYVYPVVGRLCALTLITCVRGAVVVLSVQNARFTLAVEILSLENLHEYLSGANSVLDEQMSLKKPNVFTDEALMAVFPLELNAGC